MNGFRERERQREKEKEKGREEGIEREESNEIEIGRREAMAALYKISIRANGNSQIEGRE